MEHKKIVYIIKWIKNEKPFYQMGEFVPTGFNKYIPAPPEVFFHLNIIFQAIKSKFSFQPLSLLTMGFDETEIALINKFVNSNSFIIGCKHLAKPIGRKPDGSPYRVFMVDSDFGNLKAIKKIIINEHFEIMGIAKTPEDALRFFQKNYKYIDIVIMEILLPSNDVGYEVIKQMKQLSHNLKIIIVTKSNSELDVRKAIDFKINGYIIKPVEKDKLINNIKKILK